MSIVINFKPEVEAALAKRAEIVGMDVPTLVEELITERLAADLPKPRKGLTPDEVMSRLDRIANRHTDLPIVDDSREAICSGRGE